MTSGAKLFAIAVIGSAVITVPVLMRGQDAAPHPAPPASAQPASATPAAAPHALPRFVDLGTTTCAPCRVMLGVMDTLEQEYPDTLAVEFVNVHENRAAAAQYGIRIIPTQIFYAPDGQELFRHTGVMPAAAVASKWRELGYDLGPRMRSE